MITVHFLVIIAIFIKKYIYKIFEKFQEQKKRSWWGGIFCPQAMAWPSMHQTIKHTKELERADDGTSCRLYGRDRLLRTQHFPFEILCVCFFRFLVS